MNKKFDRYLSTHRRRWGLTQEELSFLLGLQSRTVISKLEKSKRTPTLVAAFACEIIFGAVPAEIFTRIYDQVEADIMARAYELHQRLEGKPGAAIRMKLDLLDSMLARAKRRVTEKYE